MEKYCNQYFYSDVVPYEVIKQISRTVILIREMKCELKKESSKELSDSFVAGGFCGHFDNSAQDWNITSDESKPTVKVRLHKDGYYYLPNSKGTHFKLCDHPVKWYDYNF